MSNKDDIEKLYSFLDKAAGLFDGPVTDANKAFNTINLLHKKFNLFDDQKIIQIQYFFKIHRDCGLFLELIPEN
jgi:hypothetical protein